MKRYEKMSKEEIISLYDNSANCDSCPLLESCDTTNDCVTQITDWLYKEIKLVPRIAKINTSEELHKARQDWHNSKFTKFTNVFDFLAEEIEE